MSSYNLSAKLPAVLHSLSIYSHWLKGKKCSRFDVVTHMLGKKVFPIAWYCNCPVAPAQNVPRMLKSPVFTLFCTLKNMQQYPKLLSPAPSCPADFPGA